MKSFFSIATVALVEIVKKAAGDGVSPEGRVHAFLRKFDNDAFNAGFDAAVASLKVRGVNFNHPQYLRDREAEYRRLRDVS